MDALLLIARIVLCGVLLAAAFGKFADLDGSRRAMRGFGVPDHLAPTAGIALPIVELVVGLGLIPVATAWWAALGALLLMLVFIAAIAWNMSQGRAPDCHCFGQLHSEPAGPRTLVRNGVLAAVAAFVVIGGWGDPGPAIGRWVADRSAFDIVVLLGGLVILATIALLGWLVVQLMTQAGRLIERLEVLESRLGIIPPDPAAEESTPASGLPVGSLAPEFDLPDLSGAQVSLGSLRAGGHDVLLFFTNPGCEPCNRILASIPAWQQRAAGQFELVVVSRGSAVANEEKAREHGLSHVLLQDAREVNKAYGVEYTPSAVVVRANGTIGSLVAGGASAVTALVEQTLPGTSTGPPVSGLAVGQEIPHLGLATLAGTTFAGLPTDRESVLVFWSPTCGYCRRFVPDLLAWEADRPDGAPNLVFVSTGEADAIRAHGFTSTVLLDGGTGTSGRFGSRGTPSAIRVDAQGRVASPIAHGASGVMDLLQAPVSAATP